MRLQRRVNYLQSIGSWVAPPEGFLAQNPDIGLSGWCDAITSGRTKSLIDTWRDNSRTKTPEERSNAAERARHDLYGAPYG